MKIIHVVEAFGGGVHAAVLDYVHNSPQHEHYLLASSDNSFTVESLEKSPFVEVEDLPRGHLARLRRVRRMVRRVGPYDVAVHAHSSLGGLYARIATPRRTMRIYTAHCFAFERTDIGRFKRFLFWFVEKCLAYRTDVFANCSVTEQESARVLNPHARTIYVPNMASTRSVVPIPRDGPVRAETFTICGAGRLSEQKDPQFFLRCIESLRESGINVRAVWLGSGDSDIQDELERNGVEVSGWLDRDTFLERFNEADLYLHSAAWEGFPIIILEAAALGVPIVMRAIPSLRWEAFPYQIDAPADLLWIVLNLETILPQMYEKNERLKMRHSPANQTAALRSVYS